MQRINEFDFLWNMGFLEEMNGICSVILVVLAILFLVAARCKKKEKENSVWLIVLAIICLIFGMGVCL